jgi:hypothetical protein
MNDYDLLSLMDTWKAMKASDIQGLPSSFLEALTGIEPVGNEPISIPQVTQGDTNYEQGIAEVKQGEYQGKDATYKRGAGKENVPGFPIFGMQPTGQHKANIEQGKRLRTREEIGYD